MYRGEIQNDSMLALTGFGLSAMLAGLAIWDYDNLTKKQKVSAQLVDSSGKLIKELVTTKPYSKGIHDFVIDKNENNLTKGLYYLVLYGEAKSEFVKLIVE